MPHRFKSRNRGCCLRIQPSSSTPSSRQVFEKRIHREFDALAVGQCHGLGGEVHLDLRVFREGEEFGVDVGGNTIGSSEFLSALPLKMSANEVLITARNPNWVSAQGACSRELPQPKLSPASRICSVLAARRIQDEIRFRISLRVIAPVAEELLVEAFFRSRLEEARGDDLVRIDVVVRHRHQTRFKGEKWFHRMVLTSVTTPVMALAAAVRGEARKVRPPLP